MKRYEEVMKMFNVEDEKVYFSNKGQVRPEEVTIEEDCVWSEAAGMLYGSEFECYIVTKEGRELTQEEYEKFNFTYRDKRERYTESGEEYGADKSYGYSNNGINLSGAEVYILYNNFNNNEIDSFNVDIYTIK